MERIDIVYEGRPLTMTMQEGDHPINIDYPVRFDNGTELLLTQNESGKWVEVRNGKWHQSVLAELIGREYTRLRQTRINDDAFLLTVDYHGKKYNLTINPEPGPYHTSYRVLHGPVFLMKVSPPDGSAWKDWHTAADAAEQGLAAAIGRAIENYLH